jgi:hypothetical protein
VYLSFLAFFGFSPLFIVDSFPFLFASYITIYLQYQLLRDFLCSSFPLYKDLNLHGLVFHQLGTTLSPGSIYGECAERSTLRERNPAEIGLNNLPQNMILFIIKATKSGSV